MQDFDLGRGRVRAMLLAGPIFLMLGWSAPLMTGGRANDVWSALAVFPFALIFAVPIGAILAIAPALILTKLLALASRENPGLRHPALWAMVGGGLVGPWLPWSDLTKADEALAVALTGTAVTCALLCRSSVIWHD